MTTRGWRSEHIVRVVDTNDRPVDVVVGLVRDQHGRWRRALGMSEPGRPTTPVGPSALFAIPEVSTLIRTLEQSTKDLFGLEDAR